MGDPLHDLEKRLERLVPQGLSDQSQTRLEDQIDELASGFESAAKTGSSWQRIAVFAAVLALVAGVALFDGLHQGVDHPVAGPSQNASAARALDSGIEMVDYQREVEDGRDGGIDLSQFNKPVRSWNYNVKEVETVVDKKTGWKIRIDSEREEAVLTAVTSF